MTILSNIILFIFLHDKDDIQRIEGQHFRNVRGKKKNQPPSTTFLERIGLYVFIYSSIYLFWE